MSLQHKQPNKMKMGTNKTDNIRPVENIHDKFFWDVFGRPGNAAGFLKDFLPFSIAKNINFDYIDVNKKSFLSEEYKEHYSDIIIETRFKDNPDEHVYVYFLLEHKSYIPIRGAFQLLRYMVEQWYELEKKGLAKEKFPPIIPVLIYQGEKKWQAKTHFHDIVNIPFEELKPFIPSFNYLLNDTQGTDEEQFKSSVIIKCWHMIVKHLNEPELLDKIIDMIKMLFEFLQRDTALEYLDIFMKYLANTANKLTREDAIKAIETVFPEKGVEIMGGWAQEFIEEGMKRGMQQGMQQGEKQGMLTGLTQGIELAFLVKFGDTDETRIILSKIHKINNLDKLKAVKNALKDAETLNDFINFLK